MNKVTIAARKPPIDLADYIYPEYNMDDFASIHDQFNPFNKDLVEEPSPAIQAPNLLNHPHIQSRWEACITQVVAMSLNLTDEDPAMDRLGDLMVILNEENPTQEMIKALYDLSTEYALWATQGPFYQDFSKMRTLALQLWTAVHSLE